MAILFFIAAILVGGLGVAYYFDLLPGSGDGSSVKSLVHAQRTTSSYSNKKNGPQKSIVDIVAQENRVRKVSDSRLTLEKRLRYAQWKLTPAVFYGIMVLVSLTIFLVVRVRFNFVLQLFALATGPLFVYWMLNSAMMRRFQRFDKDYPSFLLSLVGLLKTGMNPIQALQAAAEGLDSTALVKQETDLMLERLKVGIPEDQSIGSFGEDIYHEEIELFVQALLLSRRVGGNLSDTLDRLAKQVRRRQYFRSSAHHAVGMQRGSIWIILAVLVALLAYIYTVAPDLVTGAWKDEVGWQVWQVGLVMILIGIFWIRQVTKIRV